MDNAVNILRMQLRESRFRRELDIIIEDNLSFTEERRKQLELIISTMTKENEQNNNKPTPYDKLIEDMQIGLFRKPWRRLPSVHKRMLFDSYMKMNEIDPITHNALMSLFIQRLNNNKYNSDATVKYSIQDEKIISINDLIKNDDGDWVFVDKKQKTKSTNKSTSKSTNKSTSKSAEKSTSKSAEKSTSKSADKSTNKSADKSAEKSTSKSAEKSANKSAEKKVKTK